MPYVMIHCEGQWYKPCVRVLDRLTFIVLVQFTVLGGHSTVLDHLLYYATYYVRSFIVLVFY